ncbi:MAG: hypothetical protein Q9175_007416, partial [Cornicularia normoerica]
YGHTINSPLQASPHTTEDLKSPNIVSLSKKELTNIGTDLTSYKTEIENCWSISGLETQMAGDASKEGEERPSEGGPIPLAGGVVEKGNDRVE